ncbi:MAG: MmgE/PrpD family protein, partial [Rhodospirillaceae bacterium]|nr:MmgE/PrpD family protein [Rhodospirillaceae bacterium]
MNDVGVTEIPAILSTLAANIVDFETDRVTASALEVAKVGVADTIGVALAGLPEPCTQILMTTPGVASAPGPCVIFGTDKRTSALDAALVNGVSSHALDYDDFSSVFGGHQSAPLVAPLFALAVEQGRSGRDILTDYVAGFEVEHRFARALHPH